MPDPSPQTFGGEWPYAVAEFRGQLIAVGAINGGCCAGGFSTDTRAVVWRSADGRSWELEPHRSAFALGHMDALATDGQTLVAAGSVILQSTQNPGDVAPIGATWTSPDGTTWTRHTGMPTFYSVVWRQGRFYGVAEDAPTSSSSVWASADGVSWSLIRRFQGDLLPILRSTPLGLVAGGSASGALQNQAPTWFSKDGTTWSRYTALGGSTSLNDIAGNASVLVAIGEVIEFGSDLSRPAFWVGYQEWSRGITLQEEPAPLIERVVWTGTHFVALGQSSAGMQAFTSADGVRWSAAAPSKAASGGPGQVTDALVLADGRLLAIGVGDGGGRHHGVPLAWIVSP